MLTKAAVLLFTPSLLLYAGTARPVVTAGRKQLDALSR